MMAFPERRDAQGTWASVDCDPEFDSWSSLYGFIADVANVAEIGPLKNRRGFPEDAGVEACEAYKDGEWYGATWYQLSELTAFDYARVVFDHRKKVSLTVREFLGDGYFDSLDILVKADVKRVIFFFSS
ncbi:hypothetical protein SAMN05216567_13414 [Variovorax sp. OK605]|nr:hypothetical protein SAMN05216567_13414 [Variovorax sp. OK605]